ncbi:hypothetical protein QA601_06000 [Chitinispirillales bacterium ANBcel5]|uniref:hypothetical protein n=1 Tax=Cellulosispirillum alkaliphilum TaxID=3039283 RepID=UPI002A534F94|nr:hypothetical protein [Chitinispirillales bacterium ANBcel5]
MQDPHYFFSIEHEGLAVELWFNDILLDSDPEGKFKNRQFLNNLFILDGENTLKLKISLPGTPPRKPESFNLKAGFHIVQEESEELPDPIAELKFPGNNVPSFPAEIQTTFTVQSPFGKWLWEDAQEIDVDDPQTTSATVSLISSLHKALISQDLDKVTDILSSKASETARAYYIPSDDRLSDQRQFFQEIFNDSQFNMEPFKPESLRFTPMANNRLLFIEQKDGSSALESTELSEGYCFCLPVCLCKIDNEYIIIR